MGPSRLDFAEQHCAELLEPGRRVIQDGQDRLRLFGLKGKRDHASPVGVAELRSELFVFQEIRELKQKRRRERDAHQEHNSVLPARRSRRERAKRARTATCGRPRGKVTDAGGSCSTHVPPIVRVLHPGIRQAESIGP